MSYLLFPVLYTAYKNNMAGIGESLYKSLICDYRTMHLPVLLTYPCSTIRLHQDLMNKWAISLVISILLSLWLCLYLARI